MIILSVTCSVQPSPAKGKCGMGLVNVTEKMLGLGIFE